MADILNQIKVGNTTYNIEPYTAYVPVSGGTIDAGGLKAPLILKGGTSNWNEGLRIVPSGNWATIMLGGNDITETEGTSANSWSIHNNDGKFYISKNGSDYASTKLSNTDGTWRVNDNAIIHSGNIGSQSVNYATSSHLLRTYNADNGSHGTDYYLKCRHNVDGDHRFKLQIVRTDGSVTHSTSVDYANSAGSANSVALKDSSGTTTKATMQYNSTEDCIEFIFA